MDSSIRASESWVPVCSARAASCLRAILVKGWWCRNRSTSSMVIARRAGRSAQAARVDWRKEAGESRRATKGEGESCGLLSGPPKVINIQGVKTGVWLNFHQIGFRGDQHGYRSGTLSWFATGVQGITGNIGGDHQYLFIRSPGDSVDGHLQGGCSG